MLHAEPCYITLRTKACVRLTRLLPRSPNTHTVTCLNTRWILNHTQCMYDYVINYVSAHDVLILLVHDVAMTRCYQGIGTYVGTQQSVWVSALLHN